MHNILHVWARVNMCYVSIIAIRIDAKYLYWCNAFNSKWMHYSTTVGDFSLLKNWGGGVRFTCVSQGLVRVRILFPNLLSMDKEYFHIERKIFRNKYQIYWYWYNTPSEPVLRLMASSSITFLRYFQSQHYWSLMMIQRNDPLN